MNQLLSNKSKSSKPLSDMAVRADVIARRGTGESCESIGKSYGVSRTSIHRFIKNHEDTVNEIKEKIFADNIDNYTSALEMDVKNSKAIAAKYAEDGTITPSEVAYKATINKAMHPVLMDKGVHPSPALAQININNSKTVNVDPDIFKALSTGFGMGYLEMHESATPDKVIEGEIKDVKATESDRDS